MRLAKYLAEFIGTLFLVLTVGMSVINPGGAGDMAPLAIAAVLAAMIWATGHVSGGHLNPAVSIGALLRGKLSPLDFLPYLLAQALAGVVAAAAVLYLKVGEQITPLAPTAVPVMLAEFLFTFALVFVVLNVATARGTAGNSFYGIAIALVVLAGAYAVGAISGGVFNPAVAVGLCVMGILDAGHLWVYLLAHAAGGVVAAIAFRVVHQDEPSA
jgi:aquaporin Z